MRWLWLFDQDAFRAVHIGLHRDWLDPIFWVLSTSGLGWVQLLLILFIPLLLGRQLKGVWARIRQPQYLVGPLIAVYVVSGAIMSGGLVKSLIARERPSNLNFAHPQESVYLNPSYPSGHTTTSFAIAFLVLFLCWGTPKQRVGWWLLGWASLVGLSRVYRGVHWPTDVLGGVFAGLISAAIVALLVPSREPTP